MEAYGASPGPRGITQPYGASSNAGGIILTLLGIPEPRAPHPDPTGDPLVSGPPPAPWQLLGSGQGGQAARGSPGVPSRCWGPQGGLSGPGRLCASPLWAAIHTFGLLSGSREGGGRREQGRGEKGWRGEMAGNGGWLCVTGTGTGPGDSRQCHHCVLCHPNADGHPQRD